MIFFSRKFLQHVIIDILGGVDFLYKAIFVILILKMSQCSRQIKSKSYCMCNVVINIIMLDTFRQITRIPGETIALILDI